MPWKQATDPYRIWLSEIILQQTRVAQGLPYFQRFVEAYPTVTALAAADDAAVMKLWEGLGYYSRARNLLAAARQVASGGEGRFPDTYAGLLKLPGVGPYTAAAIASFAFGRQVAVLDGNVYRILARYANDATPIDTGGGRKHFQSRVDDALGKADAATFNQAIMDFGALVCTPKRADCPRCPLAEHCRALSAETVYALPVKQKKLRRRSRCFHYLVVENEAGEHLIGERTGKDVWRGLWEFPLLETDSPAFTAEKLTRHDDWPAWLDPKAIGWQTRSQPYRHQLTHQQIDVVFHRARMSPTPAVTGNFAWVGKERLRDHAFPRVINRYLDDGVLTLDL